MEIPSKMTSLALRDPGGVVGTQSILITLELLNLALLDFLWKCYYPLTSHFAHRKPREFRSLPKADELPRATVFLVCYLPSQC